MKEYKEWKTQKRCFWNGRFTKKDTKNREWKEAEEKKKHDETEKKEDPPKKRSKNRYSFKHRSKKIGETRIEYKRDVKHIKNIKNIFENQGFFFWKNRRKNDETFQKRRVSLVQ